MAVLVATLVAGSLSAQDRTAELRARFQKEQDPVRKARLVAPLADAEFREMHEKINAGDLEAAAEIARQVRDEAEASKKSLDKKSRDVEAHPEGYKQLQISVRESIRRLDDIMVSLAKDDQKPLAEIRAELETLDREMIHQLFPKRPEAAPAATPAPDADKPKS
jgi:peptidoglycan hydrolase CwlO-like protein